MEITHGWRFGKVQVTTEKLFDFKHEVPLFVGHMLYNNNKNTQISIIHTDDDDSVDKNNNGIDTEHACFPFQELAYSMPGAPLIQNKQ